MYTYSVDAPLFTLIELHLRPWRVSLRHRSCKKLVRVCINEYVKKQFKPLNVNPLDPIKQMLATTGKFLCKLN